jgi:hypothetical protein
VFIPFIFPLPFARKEKYFHYKINKKRLENKNIKHNKTGDGSLFGMNKNKRPNGAVTRNTFLKQR